MKDTILESWVLKPNEYIKTVVSDGITEVFLMQKEEAELNDTKKNLTNGKT